MDKMDKTIRLLLATGIAILFPVLVYFTVLTVLPKVDVPTYPQYPQEPAQPYCNTTYYDYSSGTYKTNTNNLQCEQQQQVYQQKKYDYDQKLNQYNQDQKQYQIQQDKYDKRTKSDRAVVGIVIALIAVGFSAYMRQAKELAGGLVAGSTLIIIFGISSIIDYMGSTKKDGAAVVVMTLSFLVLSFLLYYLDKSMPNVKPAVKLAQPAAEPTPITSLPKAEPEQTQKTEQEPGNPKTSGT